MKIMKYLLITAMILLITSVSAMIDYGISNGNNPSVIIGPSAADLINAINYTNINVNNSQYLNGYSSDDFVKRAGDSIKGNLNMSNYNLTNVNYLNGTSSYFNFINSTNVNSTISNTEYARVHNISSSNIDDVIYAYSDWKHLGSRYDYYAPSISVLPMVSVASTKGVSIFFTGTTTNGLYLYNDSAGSYYTSSVENKGQLEFANQGSKVVLTLGDNNNVNVSENISAKYFFGDISQATGISIGNRFNQELNTTSNVTFQTVQANSMNVSNLTISSRYLTFGSIASLTGGFSDLILDFVAPTYMQWTSTSGVALMIFNMGIRQNDGKTFTFGDSNDAGLSWRTTYSPNYQDFYIQSNSTSQSGTLCMRDLNTDEYYCSAGADTGVGFKLDIMAPVSDQNKRLRITHKDSKTARISAISANISIDSTGIITLNSTLTNLTGNLMANMSTINSMKSNIISNVWFDGGNPEATIRINPNSLGNGTFNSSYIGYGSGVGVAFFDNVSTSIPNTNPTIRIYGIDYLGGKQYTDMYIDEFRRLAFRGTIDNVVFVNGLETDGLMSFGGEYTGFINRDYEAGYRHITFGGYSANNQPSTWVMTEFGRRDLVFGVPTTGVNLWLHDGSATASHVLKLFHDGNNGVIDTGFGNVVINKTTVIKGNMNITGNLSALIPYATFTSTETQTIASANTAYPMSFNNTEDSYLITKSGDNKNFSIALAGDYEIILSVIATSTTAGKRVNIWFEKNGVNIPRSNTPYDFKSNNAIAVIAVPFIIDLNQTDKLRIMYGADSTGVSLPYVTNTSYSPDTPSVIMTIKYIGLDSP